jgi:hypothetical protein
MTRLFAQPYDISANGFYFDDVETFERLARANRNDYGNPVEEYEIQFIDGERIDCEFANAFLLNQVNFGKFFDLVDEWGEDEKVRFIIANGECGYGFNPDTDNVNSIDLDVYQIGSLKELAEQFVEEGLFGEVPKAFENYIDYESIARDLSVDYATTDIAGTTYAYRCG